MGSGTQSLSSSSSHSRRGSVSSTHSSPASTPISSRRPSLHGRVDSFGSQFSTHSSSRLGDNLFLPPRDPNVPDTLTGQEKKILNALAQKARDHLEGGTKCQPVVCFTDIGNDRDDLLAILVLSVLVRLGLYDLRLVVVNTHPVYKRARLASGLLNSLGMRNVPVALGDNLKVGNPSNPEYYYEFIFQNMAAEGTKFPERNQAVRSVLQAAKAAGEKVAFLNIGTQRDLFEISKAFPVLVKDVVSQVHTQGGHVWERRQLKPAPDATNANNDIEGAIGWHQYLQKSGIPFVSYTKQSTFNAPPPIKIFDGLPDSETNPITDFVRKVSLHQQYVYWWCTLYPNRQVQPFFTQLFFLRNITTLPALTCLNDGRGATYDMKRLCDQMPTAFSRKTLQADGQTERVTPEGCQEFYDALGDYVKMVAYDVIPAIGMAGGPIAGILGVGRPRLDMQQDTVSGIVGALPTDQNLRPSDAELRHPHPDSNTKAKINRWRKATMKNSQMDPLVHPIALSALLKVAIRPDWMPSPSFKTQKTERMPREPRPAS